MIYSFARKDELQTNIEIQDWLDYLGVQYCKLSVNDLVHSDVALNKKDVCWLWKFNIEKELEEYCNNNTHVNRYLQMEIVKLFEYYIDRTKQYPKLSTSVLNKLVVSDKAKELGIKVPNYIVTNNRNDLKSFLLREKSVITKPINEVNAFVIGDNSFALYTEVVDASTVDSLPTNFFPSLFQTFIKKKYEIRTFYINGEFYSSAIFSSSNAKTEVDFRKYDHGNPNRTVPYHLPQNVSTILDGLMRDLGLTTGSIDLIKSFNNEYYFLEVNPDGHFGMISKPCNYYIEKEIAKLLKRYE
jgi:ATP-GRASP peptide maturase of grasp-with-spasm system